MAKTQTQTLVDGEWWVLVDRSGVAAAADQEVARPWSIESPTQPAIAVFTSRPLAEKFIESAGSVGRVTPLLVSDKIKFIDESLDHAVSLDFNFGVKVRPDDRLFLWEAEYHVSLTNAREIHVG